MNFESDFDLECDNECGPGPPPVFNIPPPPRPDFLHNELSVATTACSDNSLSDYEMCEAIPILDASYHSGPSLQTSAMILLCSVLLLIFIFVSSILIWKHKRKVQNFLPCKTPTRGALDPGAMMAGGQSLTYEDPDMHMGHHRPLVMRQQHPLNAEMLNSKALHFPSGYPMPRSPPLFICSSPGPDPYSSNGNVYEELEHRGVMGGGIVNNNGPVMRVPANRFPECDQRPPSDEEFAEDELSLPGDRSLNKSSSDNTTVATIYQERGAGSTSSNAPTENTAMYLERGRVERSSLLSSASDTSAALRANVRNSSSSNESSHHHAHHPHHYHHYNNTMSGGGGGGEMSDGNGNGGGGVASFFRFRTSRPSGKAKNHHHRGKGNFSMNNLDASSSACDEIPLACVGSSSSASNSDPISSSSNALINGNHIEGDTNNNNGSSGSSSNNVCGRNNYYGIDSEVERRNRINAQLSAAGGAAPPSQVPALGVATIFRDRNSMRNYHNHPAAATATTAAATASRTNTNYYAPPQHIMMAAANRSSDTRLSRTNPRHDRRRHRESNNNNNNNSNEEYLYHEPVYHHNDNMIYDPYLTTVAQVGENNNARAPLYHQPYVLPEFTTFRNFNNLNNPSQPLYNPAINSDSGYSQNTQNSGRSLFSRRKRNSGNNNSEAETIAAGAEGS